MSRSRLRRACVAAGIAGTLALALPATSSALPVTYNAIAAGQALLRSPSSPPPGANDWSCRPSAAHPRPVVLVHATIVNMGLNWNAVSPLLKNYGYCVFAFNYGMRPISLGIIGGLDPLAESEQVLTDFVDRVRAQTGAAKVDLIGHSQGGLLVRAYSLRAGRGKVGKIVALAPVTHGTTLAGIANLGRVLQPVLPWLINPIYGVLGSGAPGLLDQQSFSPYVKGVNALGETAPGSDYTVISTKYDSVATPYQSQALQASNATNIVVQNGCALDLVDHVGIAFDSIALRHMLNALDPANARRPQCRFVAPFIGG
ncbi:MAG: alpha/beta fold hydrolase [Solirubrobacteraceae bacterium]|nr:alpha/beta fold hydrolase [Solirubrobacteraceae bacterium]